MITKEILSEATRLVGTDRQKTSIHLERKP